MRGLEYTGLATAQQFFGSIGLLDWWAGGFEVVVLKVAAVLPIAMLGAGAKRDPVFHLDGGQPPPSNLLGAGHYIS
jgi:hypothetical protein